LKHRKESDIIDLPMASLFFKGARLNRTQGTRLSQARFISTTAAVAEKSGQVTKNVQNLVTKITGIFCYLAMSILSTK